MKTVVVYHSADFDGLFCREIARKFLPYAELIGWDFKDKELYYPPDATIYVMDLPPDKVFGLRPDIFLHLSGLIWIDHHKSAIETHPKNIPGYRIDGVSACRLCWTYFTHPASPFNANKQ